MLNTYLKSFKSNSLSAAIALSSAVLVGCGGGGGGAADTGSVPTSPRAESSLSGSAVKGVIRNGLVSAYRVELRSGVLERAEAPLAGPVRTDQNGDYTLTLDAQLNAETLIVEVVADAQTVMKCDVTDGCGTDASGNAVGFGDWFALAPNFNLQGLVLDVEEGDAVSAHMSPLTHMVVARASASLEGLSPSSIADAKTYIETQFDLSAGAIDLAPADITELAVTANLTKDQLEASVVSAALLSLVNSPDWDGVDEVLDHVADKLSSGGDLAAVNMGNVRDVSLDDVFYEANEIGEDLVQQLPESEYSEELQTVVNETQTAYDQVAQTPNQVDPVSIVAQPVSVTVDEGERISLAVSAQGGGDLSYQWRKSGQAIDGANSASFSLVDASLSDAGTYDVVVSNVLGSVASLVALVEVSEVVVQPDPQPDPEPVIASIDLSWDIPTEREDGSALALHEINGYEIRYGTSSGNLTETVAINGGGETGATIEDLPAGTYFFAIATIDSDGVRGNFSGEIQETIM